jgi:hypothetical protein
MVHICLGKNVNNKYLKTKCPGTYFDLGMMKQASSLDNYITTA